MSSKPTLHNYQHKFITEVYECIRSGAKRILGVAPTGSGKTIIASQIVSHAVERDRRVLFIVHRDVLIGQTANKFKSFGVDCGFIKAGWKENRESLVQIASVQTLPRRDWWRDFPAELVILDEAHLVGWVDIVQKMMAHTYPQAIYLGLTATPWRMSRQEAMGDIFDHLVCAPLPGELIDQGYLVKPSYYSLGKADLEKVGTQADGDCDEGELAIVSDRPELIEKAVNDWKRLAFGRRTIAFCVNVKHSKHVCETFQSAGIPAAHVDGSTPIKVRKQIYSQLTKGEILVLCSCMSLGEGFDCPPVSAILLLRYTRSKALYFQEIGRGLRISLETDKRDCLVLDQVGIVNDFRYIEDLKEVSLYQGKDPGPGEGSLKDCPVIEGGCGVSLYSFQMCCPKCGYRFPSKKVALLAGLEQCLSEGDRERLQFYHHKLQVAFLSNYAPGWAAMVFKDQFGHWPPDAWAQGAVYGACPTPDERDLYREYLMEIAQRKDKPMSWVNRYYVMQFGWREPADIIQE